MSLKINRKKKTEQKKNSLISQDNDLRFSFIAANAAEEKKGENILLLDVSRLTAISSYFLLITAKSQPQIEAIASNIEEELSKMSYKLLSKEGFVNSNWIVLDFGDLVVHVMTEKERDYYKLERFWSNARTIERKKWKKAS